MRLLPNPPKHALLVIGFDDAPHAADHVPELLGTTGLVALEGFDAAVVDNIRKHGEHPAGLEGGRQAHRQAPRQRRRLIPDVPRRPRWALCGPRITG